MIDQMLRKIRHFIFLLFAFILLLTACSLAEEAGSRLGRVFRAGEASGRLHYRD